MEYGCIGEKLTHSFSKEIHHFIADYKYELKELSHEQIESFIKNKNFKAINVTIPYKETVIPYLDSISENAIQIGAVNTIVNRNGRLYGYNTDFFGMRSLILHENLNLEGKKVLILGTGGTSKTARAVVRSLGASEIILVSREKRDGCITYSTAVNQHADSQIIINTTPCGMFPNSDASPLDLTAFQNLDGVIDAIYNPLRTELVLSALECGVAASGGLYMLIAQAVRAAEIFFGAEISDLETLKCTERIYLDFLKKKENIALIGMPGCGKSTVGKALSERIGFPLFDCDVQFEAEYGISSDEFIRKFGENAFRDAECSVISELASKNGVIISTGGGVVLRKENIRRLRRNSRIFFIDRPIDMLEITSNRPLSATRELLEKRFSERYGLYSNAADIIIDGSPSVGEIASQIINEIKELHK